MDIYKYVSTGNHYRYEHGETGRLKMAAGLMHRAVEDTCSLGRCCTSCSYPSDCRQRFCAGSGPSQNAV